VSLHEKINDFAKSLFLQEYEAEIQEFRAECVELGRSGPTAEMADYAKLYIRPTI
jgi:hypothetical protein